MENYKERAAANLSAYRTYDSVGAQIGGIAKPASLGALCQQLERYIERAREASLRIRDHGDHMFGPRPESVGNAKPDSTGQTLANLIDELGEQISAIENGLARL